jgi:hypothetical protein
MAARYQGIFVDVLRFSCRHIREGGVYEETIHGLLCCICLQGCSVVVVMTAMIAVLYQLDITRATATVAGSVCWYLRECRVSITDLYAADHAIYPHFGL